jgi:hypothetical protein
MSNVPLGSLNELWEQIDLLHRADERPADDAASFASGGSVSRPLSGRSGKRITKRGFIGFEWTPLFKGTVLPKPQSLGSRLQIFVDTQRFGKLLQRLG